MNIIKKIDNWGTTSPNKIAYDYLGTTNTYADLKNYSDKLATYLNQLNLDTKNPIMVFGGQDFNIIATFLGIVKAGYAYIPVDTHSPVERLNVINDIAKPAACIAVEELPEGFNGLESLPIVDQAKLEDIFSNGDVVINEEKYVSGDDNFYIIFTSGTTGVPKGVQISHDNLLSFVNWELNDFSLPEHPSFLAQAPYSFDLSVMSLYPALTAGGKLVVLPHDVTENIGQLFKTLPQLKFNVWVSTPSFVEMSFLDPTFDAKHHPELTHFLFCGEELSHKTAKMLKLKFPDSHIFNTYGPTETTVAVTQVEITDEILNKYDRLPIGVSKNDTKISIDTSKGEEDNQGEVVIEGPSVSKGYLNNPEKTEAAFFKESEHESYRTGDLGFLDGDMLFYRGRIDFQVKFNGYRIELEEINFYLAKNPLVRYGVVAPKYNKDHKVRQLVAVVELADGVREKYTDAELTKKLRESLSQDIMPYMLPQRFIYSDEMPISQNGKVDIKQVIKEVNNA